MDYAHLNTPLKTGKNEMVYQTNFETDTYKKSEHIYQVLTITCWLLFLNLSLFYFSTINI